MNQINPETTITKEAPKEGNLSQEEILKVAESNSMEHLNDDQKLEFTKRFIEEGEELPQQQETVPEPKELEEPQNGVEPDQQDKSAVPGYKYVEKANEANKYKQKTESLAAKLKQLEEENKKLEAIKGKVSNKSVGLNKEDLLDEKNIVHLEDEILTLKSTIKELVDSQKSSLVKQQQYNQSELDELQKNRMYLNIYDLQDQNPELKTSKSIMTLNEEYTSLSSKLGENLDRYLNDPEYRKQKESEGVRLNINDSDWNVFSKMLDVNQFMRQNNINDFDYGYYKWKKDNGQFEDPVKKAAMEASKSTVEKLTETTNKATTLSPSDGAAFSNNGVLESEQKALDYLAMLNSKGGASTMEESQMIDAIIEKFGNQ